MAAVASVPATGSGAAAAAAPGGPPAQPAPPPAATPTSLYVGDLEAQVTEAQLYELFSSVGPVVSIRVCRDLITRRSLGYSYVNFQQSADAARAIDLLNFTAVNGQPIRILFSQRDPSSRKSGVGNIYIKNLDKDIDNKALYDTFAQFGTIVSAKIAQDSQGNSRGHGFVQFDSAEAAQSAIDQVNGMLLNGKQVYVGPFQKRNERDTGSTKFTNVYVKNLADSVTDEMLTEKFGEHGKVTSAVVMKDADGKSKGFGFVNFEDPDAAAKAVEALEGHEVDEKAWVVCRAQKKSEREQELKQKFEAERRERMEKMAGSNLYVKNLNDDVDDEKLRDLFKEYGTVTSCRVMKDQAGASKGSGFVAFSSAEEATRAVTEMNGKMVGAKPLYVALAQRKEERRMRLQAQFAQRNVMVGGGALGPGAMPMYPPGIAGAPMFYQPGVGMPLPYGMQPGVPGARPPAGMMPPYMMQAVPPGARQVGAVVGGRGGRGGRGAAGGRGGGAGRQGVRYNANVRNVGMEAGMMPVMMDGSMVPPPPQVPPTGAPTAPMPAEQPNPVAMLATQLASAPPEQQRMLLGEALYPLVDAIEHGQAAKITGMLLEMDQSEVLNLIESPDALKDKVTEALEVLKAASGQ